MIRQGQTISTLIDTYTLMSKSTKRLFFTCVFLGVLSAVLDGVVLISLSKILGATSESIKATSVISILNQILYPNFLISLFGKTYTAYICLGIYTFLLFTIKTLWLRFTSLVVAKIGHEIGQKAFDSVLWQDFDTCLNRVGSSIVSDFSHMNFAINGVITPLIDLWASLASGFIISLVILINSREIGVVITILLFGFYLWILVSVRKRLSSLSQIYRDSRRDLVNIQQIGIDSYRNIMLNGDANWLSNIFSINSIKTTNITGTIFFLQRFPRIVIDLILFASVVIILFIYSFLNISLNFGFFTFIVLALVRLIPPVQAIYRNITNIRSNIFALTSLTDFTKTKSNNLTMINESGVISDKDIILKNIFYSFTNRPSDNILNGIDLVINNREHLGLIGESGCGKSTLLDIVIGFLKPSSGSVEVDNKNIFSKEVYNRMWLNSCYIVSQNEHIFNGTFLENILFDSESNWFSKQKLDKAIELSDLMDLISKLPDGLYTKLGNGGHQLSGGQKQRVFIARAIYKSRPYLFLDEATSALDPYTESKVLSNINTLLSDTTIVSISHNESTLKYCNKICRLKNGLIS